MKLLTSLKSFFEKCRRVLIILKKPTKDEFLKVAKVSAVSIIIIGFIGFIISNIIHLFYK